MTIKTIMGDIDFPSHKPLGPLKAFGITQVQYFSVRFEPLYIAVLHHRIPEPLYILSGFSYQLLIVLYFVFIHEPLYVALLNIIAIGLPNYTFHVHASILFVHSVSIHKLVFQQSPCQPKMSGHIVMIFPNPMYSCGENLRLLCHAKNLISE